MKNFFYVAGLAGILLLGSCEDPQNPVPFTPSDPSLFYKSERLYFSTYPQSPESVKFWFPSQEYYNEPLSQLVLLSQNNDTLAIAPIESADFQPRTMVSELNFEFKEGESYQLFVDQKINNDSIFRFQLPDYQHIYKEQLNIKPLAQFARLHSFDLSPDRNYLFFNDYTGNVESTYRLEINAGQYVKLKSKFGTVIRAVDKNRLLYRAAGPSPNEILLYDLEKDLSVSLGFNIGGISRVAEGHVIYGNALERTLTVVNLDTDERRVIPEFDYGYFIRENIIAPKFYFRNSILNIENLSLSENLAPFEGAGLLQYIPEKDFVFYNQRLGLPDIMGASRNKFVAGKRGVQPSFESEEENSVIYNLPSETKLVNDKFLIYVDYRSYQYEHRVSGFYQVDLTQGTMSLVHSQDRLNHYPRGLIQLKDNVWLSIFTGEIALYQLD